MWAVLLAISSIMQMFITANEVGFHGQARLYAIQPMPAAWMAAACIYDEPYTLLACNYVWLGIVIVNQDEWQRMSPEKQLWVACHELAHTWVYGHSLDHNDLTTICVERVENDKSDQH